MNIPELAVRRPVSALMATLVCVVLGVLALLFLQIELMPDLSFPVAAVITKHSGASSEDVESRVTKIVEAAVSRVKDVKIVQSTSQEGLSIVLVEFEWGTNIDFAAQDMRDAVGMVKSYLPGEIDDPVVMKFDPNMIPVLVYGIRGKRDLRELRTLVEDQVKDRLEMVDGVATVMLMGGREREIQVLLDRDRLDAHGLSIQRVIQSLRYENLNVSAGHVKEPHLEFLIRTMGEFSSLDEIRDTIIGMPGGKPVRIRDIGRVVDGHPEPRSEGRVNRENGILVAPVKESGANTADVVVRAKVAMAEILRSLPPDIEAYIVLDQGKLTELMVANTRNDALWGGLAAIVILLLVLRDIRATVIVALAIPISILVTLFALQLSGSTFNIMSMSGLALGVGMLVSNAIIVVENISRFRREGKSPDEAAGKGTAEVLGAVTASTLTTVAVFLPLFFAPGMSGRLSRDLAMTVTFSLLASLFVAVVTVPMLASRLFAGHQGALDLESEGSGGIVAVVGRAVQWCIGRPWTIVAASVIGFCVSMLLLFGVGQEFMPPIDAGLVIVKVKMPVGSTLEDTDKVVKRVETIMLAEEELDVVCSFTGVMEGAQEESAAFGMSNVGVNEAMVFAHAISKSERSRTTPEVQDGLRRKLPLIEGGTIEFMDLARTITSGGGGQFPVEVKVFGTDTRKIIAAANVLAERMNNIEGLYDINVSTELGKPELRVHIDRQKALQSGLTAGQIGMELRAAFQGTLATLYRAGDKEHDLRVKYDDSARSSPGDVKNALVLSPFGSTHRLSEFATFSRGRGPVRLFRENQKRKVSVTANISGRSLGDALTDISRAVSEVDIGGGFVEYGGELKRMSESTRDLLAAFVLAVLLVYMIMASQFESLLHPFVVIFTVPLGFMGVVVALFATGTTLNVPALLGLIVMAGVVVNNGIVLVDYINKLRERGVDRDEAIVRGTVTKLRPMLLTAGVAVVGMLPMAISRTEGCEMRAPIALAVIGGMVASTFLMLFFIPALYRIFDGLAGLLRRRSNGAAV